MITKENTKTLRDLIDNSAKEYKDNIYLRYENNDLIYDLSYERFGQIARTISAWLNSKKYVTDRKMHVGLFGASSTKYVPLLLGVMASGNVSVPLDIQLNRGDLADCLNRSDIDVLFYDWEHKPLIDGIKELCPNIKEYYSIQTVKGEPCLNDILIDTSFSGEKWVEKGRAKKIDKDDLAMILFTSGTTGHSKGVMLTHGNLIANTFATRPFELEGEDVCLSVLPIHHVFCLRCDYLFTMMIGGLVCINGSLADLTKHLMLFEPMVIRMVPMIAKAIYNKIAVMASADNSLTENELFKKIYGRRLKKIICGGGYLAPDLAEKYFDAGIDIGQGYGMSEYSPVISDAVRGRKDKLASVGKTLEGVLVRSVDGELQIKGPSLMKGYYKDEEITKEAFTEDGYFKTGDLGYIDDEGFIYLTGRSKNLIILSNGENVAPEEIENLFMTERLVVDVVVYGEEDRILCEIYPDFDYADKNGISDIQSELEAIVKRINSDLPSFKRIMRTTMRRSPFPKTSSKKVIRSEFLKEKQAQNDAVNNIKKPESEDQKKIYEVCAESLGNRKFGIDTDLFSCGLDSFGAIMLLTSLQEKYEFNLTLSELMEYGTVEKLAEVFDKKKNESHVDYTIRETYPLTKLQMYFAYVMRGNTTANLPFFFKLDNKIDPDKLEEAIKELFKVHPVLNDIIQPGPDGKFLNFRDDNREAVIERMTMSDSEWEEKKQTLLVPYTYLPGERLYHIGIYITDTAKYLFFDVAHIIGDGMSMNIILDDLNRLYLGLDVKKETYTFYEYILDEYDREAKGLREKDIAFISDLLKGYKIKRSILAKKDSYDLTKAHNATIKGRFKSLNTKRIKGFCNKYGISENVVFLTAFNYVISLFGMGDDVVSTSIHNGRTDGRWARLMGSLFVTYLFRYQKVPHETVIDLLKKSGDQILHSMECHMSSQHADEMFIQYQGDLLDINKMGGEKAEPVRLQLDSLPFHLMVYAGDPDYTYELRYWENRFDRDMLVTFLAAMEDVINAMPEETSVRKLKTHISQKLYPKHFEITVEKLNAALGYKVIEADDNKSVKIYVLDENGLKKPYGAWGKLYVLKQRTTSSDEEMESLYTPGTLYYAGHEARITPKGEVEALYQAGRTIQRETITGRFFPNLFELEQLLIKYSGVAKAEASIAYGENNLFYLTADLTVNKPVDVDKLKEFVADNLGKNMAPSIINIVEE
ncbi:MAG: AMP-binding protein [Lachnospiraceae bacterium]|nr:AMP-binding protein [Lachnospiraceae bacterium]